MSTDPDLVARVERLEHLVEQLYRQIDFSAPAAGAAAPGGPASVSPEVQQLALSGELIQAIKLQRQQTGQDLRAAKAAVDSFASPPGH